MSPLHFARLAIPVAAGAVIACSDQSLVGPDTSGDGVAVFAKVVQVPGIYDLSFDWTSEGLVLIARVRYASSGEPAQTGEARFYSCSLRGAPAPSSACETGTGHWSYEGAAGIIPTGINAGYALLGYGGVPAGTTIGFKFRYAGARNEILKDESEPADFTAPL